MKNVIEIEKSLVELQLAHAAGVFRTTDVERAWFSELPPASRNARMPWVLRVGVAVAAMLVVATGVGSWMFSRELSNLRGRATTSVMAKVGDSGGCDWRIMSCMGGPSTVLPYDCRDLDYDHDGDIDLADLGVHQRRCAKTVG